MKRFITLFILLIILILIYCFKGKLFPYQIIEYVNNDIKSIIIADTFKYFIKTEEGYNDNINKEGIARIEKINKPICYGNNYDEYKKLFQTKEINMNNCGIFAIFLIDKYLNQLLIDFNTVFSRPLNQYPPLVSLTYNLKNNYGAINKTTLFRLLSIIDNIEKNKEPIDNDKLVLYEEYIGSLDYYYNEVINHWLSFSKVDNIYNCSVVNRRYREISYFFKDNKYILMHHNIIDTSNDFIKENNIINCKIDMQN